MKHLANLGQELYSFSPDSLSHLWEYSLELELKPTPEHFAPAWAASWIQQALALTILHVLNLFFFLPSISLELN